MDTLSRIGATLASEFSDIADVEEFTRLVVRLVVAALLGGLVGIERELARRPAGLRTHMLVAVGSALFVLVPLQAGMQMDDLSRVVQGLLAGVGFLCAGSILKGTSGDDVHGLTTAASLWMTAAIGMAAGLGRESTAAVSTLLLLGILALEAPLRRSLLRRRKHVVVPDDR